MAHADPDRPAISIVTATYNRSRALACAIESVRRQTFTNWEMIVVGDACTDDTADVVARFADCRIRFINLERNFGEQAGPNNIGVAESKAPLIAFLSHDDVWLPNHLKLCRETLQAERADLVFGAMANLSSDNNLPLRFEALRISLEGIFPGHCFSPAELDAGIVPASSWLVRKDALTRLGGWRLSRDCVVEPSQDLLFRMWHAGYRLRAVNFLTLVVVAAGVRPGSYVQGTAPEQEWVLERLDDPGFATELLACSRELPRPSWWRRQLSWASARLGVNPRRLVFRYQKGLARGDYITRLRSVRGLPALTPPIGREPALRFEMIRRSCRVDIGSTISFTAGGGGARYLASGWSRPEKHGVWNDGAMAELLFDFGRPVKTNLLFEFTMCIFAGPGEATRFVEVLAGDGRPLDSWVLGPKDGPLRRLLVPASVAMASLVHIRFRFANPASPRSLGLSGDTRQLAMGLVQLRIDAATE
jgi:glycosyltransferase involved in cell wall biosynthesis